MKNTKNVRWCILALAICSACSVSAEETKPANKMETPKPELIVFTNCALIGYVPILTITPSRYITMRCGKGEIKINCETGAVETPKDIPLDKSAVEFWKAIAAAFPEAKRQIIANERKP